jgi:predicted transcriptional regulator
LDDLTASVELLLKQFTPKQAIIYLLKEAFQYQAKEIADILDTTEMAVKSILHRAKKRLEKDHAADSFWNEEEREQLSDLFYEALKTQDPTILIQSIPTLKSIMDVPALMVKNYSPSSTLCMAA